MLGRTEELLSKTHHGFLYCIEGKDLWSFWYLDWVLRRVVELEILETSQCKWSDLVTLTLVLSNRYSSIPAGKNSGDWWWGWSRAGLLTSGFCWCLSQRHKLKAFLKEMVRAWKVYACFNHLDGLHIKHKLWRINFLYYDRMFSMFC